MQDPYLTAILGGAERNVDMIGSLVTWLATNNHLALDLASRHGSEIARLKMQDMTGAAFLTTVLHGDLKPEHVDADIRGFCETYVNSGAYQQAYEAAALEDRGAWEQYDVMAPQITSAFREHSTPESALSQITAKILRFPSNR